MTPVERDASSAVPRAEATIASAARQASGERSSHITVVRVAAALLGLATVGLAFAHPRFRGTEGELTGAFVVPLSVAAVLLLAALCARAGRITALGWLGLAVLGQAAALQLMRAGHNIGYQRYAPAIEMLRADSLPWTAVLLIQALAVLIGGRRVLASTVGWLRTHTALWRMAAIFALFTATAAVLERDAAAFAIHVVIATLVQALGLASIVLAAAALDTGTVTSLGSALDRWLGPRGAVQDTASPRIDRFALLAAIFATVAAALLGLISYQWHPHVPDELSYLLHARYLAEGVVSMPSPPTPAAFEIDLMTVEPQRWYSPLPPGWPLMLAVGARVGLPWLVNPILAGLSVLMTYALVRSLYDVRTARLTVLMLCASPWFIFMAMSLMTHTFTLAAALAGALAVVKLLESRNIAWALAAGACIGILSLVRPLEAAAVAGLFAAWVALVGTGWRRITNVVAMAIASIAVAILVLPYNTALTGKATVFPLMAYTDAKFGPGTNALGFGANRGLGWGGLDPFPGHGPIDVIVNTALNLYQVNVELLGFLTGSMLPIAVLLFLGRLRRSDAMMLVAVLVIVGAHVFYWFSGGPDFGARYWYLILVPCVVLAARGVYELADRLELGYSSGASVGGAGTRVVLAALALCFATWLTFFPWRATDKYYHYRGMRPDIRRLADEHDFGESLVLVRGRRFPDYMSAAAYNPIDLHAPVPVYAWDRNAETRKAVLHAYADRRVWIVAGPTETGGAFRIERGPVSAQELLQEEESER